MLARLIEVLGEGPRQRRVAGKLRRALHLGDRLHLDRVHVRQELHHLVVNRSRHPARLP
jgi:hypothetical protein